MAFREPFPRLVVPLIAALAIAVLTGALSGTSVASAAAAASAADQVSPLCQLEGGQDFAVDTGQSEQDPDDPVVHPMLMAGDRAEVTLIPCWASDPTPSRWITSVSVTIGDDHTLVGQATGLHTVDPFTVELNGSESIPPAPTLTPLTVHATDNDGVERWSATVSLKLLTLCADDTAVDVDTGVVHDAYLPQLEGGAAQVTVVPCPVVTSTSDTWVTSVTAWIWDGGGDDQHPIAEVSGLHATSPFPLDLHRYDHLAFLAGPHTLHLDVTDNHGNVASFSRQIWVVDPVSASWSVGTTLPDTATTVRANFRNTSGSPITAVTLEHDSTTAGEPTPVELADDLSSVETTMTFPAGPNRIWADVTLANGITYPLNAYNVDARYVVDTSVAAPDDADWGELTTFHAKAVSSSGTVQRGVTLHLQSRAPGSTRWVERAAAPTDTHGRATLTVRAARTGTAAWRVTSAGSKLRFSSVSSTHLVRVHAVFGRLPAQRSVHVGHVVRYNVKITPATARARVDVQAHRVGRSGWTTPGHTTSGPVVKSVAIRPGLAGQYKVRYVVESTKTVARTVSREWKLRVTR